MSITNFLYNTKSDYFVSHRSSVGRFVRPAESRPPRLPRSRLGLLCNRIWYKFYLIPTVRSLLVIGLTLNFFQYGQGALPADSSQNSVSVSNLHEDNFEIPPNESVKSESEIPLNLRANNTKTPEGATTSKILVTFFVLGSLLIGGLVFAKKFSRTNITNSQNEIKVLTQHWLGPKKSIAVIRVAGESILLGITDQNINLIKSLSLLDEDIPDAPIQSSFNQALQSKINQTESANAKTTFPKDQVTISATTDDEFSFGSIKKSVGNKLKNMRSLNS